MRALVIIKDPAQKAAIEDAFKGLDWCGTFISLEEVLLNTFELTTTPMCEYDWVFMCHIEEAQIEINAYALIHQLKCLPTMKNFGFLNICFPASLSAAEEYNFWVELTNCLHKAHHDKEPTPQHTEAQPVHHIKSGFLQFQTPAKARIYALALSHMAADATRVYLGLWEMFINGIEHGNLGISHAEKRSYVDHNNMDDLIQKKLKEERNKNKFVTVEFTLTNTSIYFDIQDDGEGFDWQKFLEIDQARLFDKNGRGIALARMAGFDSLCYLGKGNHVQCSVRLDTNE